MPGLGAPTNLQEERYPRLVCVCVSGCVYVCHNISNLLQTFVQLAFVVCLAPARCSQARSVALSPSAELLNPDALRMSSNNGPGQQHRPVAGRGRKPGNGNGRRLFASLTSALSSPYFSFVFFCLLTRSENRQPASHALGWDTARRGYQTFKKILNFCCFVKLMK